MPENHPSTKPKARGTRPTQMRLDDAIKAKIEEIRENFGLPSLAAAVRYSVEQLHKGLHGKGKPRP